MVNRFLYLVITYTLYDKYILKCKSLGISTCTGTVASGDPRKMHKKTRKMWQCKTVLLYFAIGLLWSSSCCLWKKSKAVVRSLKGEAYLLICMAYDEADGPEVRGPDHLPDYAMLFSAAGATLEHFLSVRAASDTCHFTSPAAEA